jgi:alkylation response protein AidB-like acyl-CoA dehydrogenase
MLETERHTESVRTFLDAAHALAVSKLAPAAEGIDASGEVPGEKWKAMSEQGLAGVTVPVEAGGAGHPWPVLVRTVECLAGGCAACGTALGLHAAAADALARHGSEAARAAHLGALASGESMAAIVLPESRDGTGTVVTAVTARADGDGFVLDGTAHRVPGGRDAGLLFVVADTGDGRAAFLVPGDAPGIGRTLAPGVGLRGIGAVRIRFENVRVDADDLLGAADPAGAAAWLADGARLVLAASAVGIGERAVEEATGFAMDESEGPAPGNSQAVQWLLADSVTELEAARLVVQQAAWRRERGEPHDLEVAMGRLAAGRAAVDAAHRALEVQGGAGADAGSVGERAYRDARTVTLLGGSLEAEREAVAAVALAEGAMPPDRPAVPLSEEQSMLRDMIREFAREQVARNVDEHESARIFPRDLVLRMWSELGVGAMLAAEDHGGLGLDPVAYNIVVEELAREWPALSIIVAVHNSVNVQLIDLHGTEEQKAKYIPKLATEWIGAFSLSEPGAGSDVGALRATAVRDGDDYVLNGEKNWVTNGLAADLYVVFAKTDPAAGNRGITAFLVERDTPGLTVGKPEKKMGIRSSEAVTLTFDDCRIPVGQRLGEEGEGFRIAMMELDGGRIGVASQALGIAAGAFSRSVRYARERVAFGRPISEFQAIRQMVADMALRIRASRLLVHRAATLRAAGEPHSRQASMAKLYATEGSTLVAHRAIQIHGGYGYTEDYQVERFYRDARVTEIYEGTSEIQRLVIARNWLKEHGFKAR